VLDADSEFLAEPDRGRPIETVVPPGDHLQTIWQLWLPGHQLGQGARPWVDPYSFQPEVDARPNFAGWPFGLVFGPMHRLLGTVVAWNVFVLLGYLGAGAFTFLWLRGLGLGVGAAAVGGLVFALAPYRAAQAGGGHLLAWISMLLPLSLWAWERRWYWLSAAAIASIPLSGQVHLALGAIPFFAAYALVRGGSRRWTAGAVTAAVAAGLLVWASSIRGSIGDSRSFAQVDRYSADLADFVSRDPRHGLEAFVFVGWLVPLLAVAGLVLARSRLASGLGAAAGVVMLLALGANLPGYESLWTALPGLGATRVPGRLMPIACLALAGLAALAVSRIRRRWAPLVVLLLVALDLRVGVTAYGPAAADPGNRAYAALRAAGPGRMLELPIVAPDEQQGSVYLYYAMQAPRERPAGYSTVAPREAALVLRRLGRCPGARQLDELGVRFVTVHGIELCPPSGRLLARGNGVASYRR
jgi:hypothetical protein